MHAVDRSMPESVKLESAPCPLGCRLGDDLVLRGQDRLNRLPGVFHVVRCRKCGLMRTDPRPSPENMKFYYPDQYGPYRGTRIPFGREREGTHSVLKRWVKRLFEFNTTRLPELEPASALEIGCASGSFLYMLSQQGWRMEGVEFSDSAAQSARSLGFTVYSGSLESAPDPSHLFRLVVGWMVLEHLHDPVLALQKIHRWVEPNGWFALSVPNAGALEFSIFKHRWYALHLPNHLYHFTTDSLSKLLEAGGWRMIRVFHQRTLTNIMGSLGYWLQDHDLFPGLSRLLADLPESRGYVNYVAYPLACLFSLLGETGRMTVWATKIHD